MTPIVRELLASALGLPPSEIDGLELLAHVSAMGRSHVEPGLRLFAYRGASPLASVKRLPKPDAHTRDLVVSCYTRLAGGDGFRVPELLAWREDDDHLYLVESIVPGRSLAELLAADAISADHAAERLDAVLRDLWTRGAPADRADIEHQAEALRRAAIVLFEDQRARDLVDAVLTTLRERHPDALRRVLTTRDVHSFNVHLDDAGQTWLTDFDLADEVAFFGLDVVRTWVHSAPLVPPPRPPFIAADAYRLHEAIYPIYEYALQAPLLPDAEREGLRAYAQDLFVRLNLPSYHRTAVAQPAPFVGRAPEAQVGFTDVDGAFQEEASLRIPFDLDTGRARLTTVIRSQRPLGAVRLMPINLVNSVVTVQRWTVSPLGAPGAVLDAAQCVGSSNGTAAHLTHLLPLPGRPRTFFAAADDPLIVVPVAAADGDGGGGGTHVYALDLELSLLRHWVFMPGFDPALLLGRLQARIESLDAARAYELEHARDLAADVRTQARLARRIATQLSVEPSPLAAPPAGVAALAARRARLPRDPRVLARLLAAEAMRRWQGVSPSPAAPAAGLIPVAVPGRAWAPPHVAVLVDGDGAGVAAVDALAWAAQQTCDSTEVVVWSRANGLAWDARQPHAKWHAADWAALRATLAARYVVFASADLLAQAPVYLERALLALEPEDLCFAITVGGALAPAATAIVTGRGPGSDGNPLPRTVARPEVVTDDARLDLDAARAERGAAGGALGKLLGDTGAPPAEPLSFARPLAGAAVGVLGPYVVAEPALATAAHPISAVDRVLPLPPLPSELPTVLMVFPFLAVGGAERVHLDVVRGLRDRIRFVIAAIEPHDDRLGSTAEAFRALTPYVYTAPDSLHPLLTTSFFEHLIQRFAPRTLYVANGSGWIYDALWQLRLNHPRLRIANQVYDFAAGWIERLDAPLMSVIDAHISCNRRISAALTARGAREGTALTIHNAVDLALFDPAAVDADRRTALKARFGLPADRRVVAFIGRMHQQKRPMDVVELARQLRGDTTLAFLMVGDGPLAATVRAQVEASGLDNVVVRAFHQPSSECYAVADVLILPSEYEGMPMVIIEALAMGVPVVATDVGTTREVLERTGGGRVVERVGEVAALRQAVTATLAAPLDPAALRAAVAREFGMATMLDEYAQALLGSDA